MNWLIGLHTLVVVGINLHALTVLVISRGKATLALRRLARRSGWLALGFLVLSVALDVLAVRLATSALDNNTVDPAARARVLAIQISVGMNCAALSALGAILPVFAALWLSAKARRS